MKKALKIIVNALAWILLILAFLVTILVFTSERNNGIPSLFGVMPMTVESDSMAPTFKKGDMIFVKETDLYDLKVDDVITFYTVIDGNRVKNTHHIVAIEDLDNSARNFTTKGDNNPVADESPTYSSDIIGRWTGAKIPGFGKVLNFLRTKTGFFICILIPMALFFLFELYKFIVTLIEVKKPKISKEDEEEIKRKAIEEFLAKERASAGAGETADNAADAVKEASDEIKETVEVINENNEE